MAEAVIPASPNWYCSKVTDSNSSGHLVFSTRHDVFHFDCQTVPPTFRSAFCGHREKVTAVSLCNHDQYSNLCCSAAENGQVKLWQLEDHGIVGEHSMHKAKVTAMCWSAVQADLIVTGDESGTIGVWQFADNRQSAHRPDKGSIFCMAASPSNAEVVAVGYKNGQVFLINIKHGAAVFSRLRGHDEEVHSLAWCPVAGETFKPVQQSSQDITDLESFGVDDSWRKPKPAAADETEGFGTDGWLLASGSRDRTIRIWSTSKSRQLLLLKLPNPGRREKMDDGGKVRLWLTLCWPKHTPHQLVSSSHSGDLLLWDITKSGKSRSGCLNAPGRGHTRLVFNICQLGAASNLLCTVSMDRQLMFWDVDVPCQVGVLPTLGGYAYTAKTSPFDPGRLALGVGDAMIRLWNLNTQEMTSLWQGIRSKVTALCWHPKKEGVLAYGTEDGRIGIYDTLSNKSPLISTTYHRRTVYVVSWGPPSSLSGEDDNQKQTALHVYSCGDGNILEHDPRRLGEEALSINKLIQETNPGYRCQTRVPTRSEISWRPDLMAVAVGNDDGTVEIYTPPNFCLIATIQVHHKLVNCIQWHPLVTMETSGGSPCQHWLAVGSNESTVCIINLTNVFEKENTEGQPLHITECFRKLEGHANRITGLAWSPHADTQLSSVSYDGHAIVWNVQDGSIQACYSGHQGRLLCVQWNGLDRDEVITGGDDFCVHRWKVSKNPVQPGQLGDGKKKKKKKAKQKIDALDAMLVGTDQLDTMETNLASMTTEDQEDITALLEEKRNQLTAAEGGDIIVNGAGGEEPAALDKPAVDGEGSTGDDGEEKPTVKGDTFGAKFGKPALDKKKRKAKSMFPECGRRENRGKQFVLDDLVTLARIIYGDERDNVDTDSKVTLTDELAHLGLFLDRRAVYTCLGVEGEHHRNNENMEYIYQLEIWKGNIDGVLRVARQREELTDWLVAMAPMASFETWTAVCEDYAIQLEADGQYHKAASYFLACHKVYDALKLFKRHKLFKEAIALAKVRLSPLDPVLEELYTLWAQQLTKDGNYEQAAKCHLAMKQVQDAAKLLARRYDQSSLKTAAHISMIANDRQQCLMYTQRLVHSHIVKNEWQEAYEFLNDKKDLQIFLATSSIHEMLSAELTKMGILAVDSDCFTKTDKSPTRNILLPEFILDHGDVNTLSPWQPHLVEGHTFPHHVLRTWYCSRNINMNTTSLEDMYKTLSLLRAGRQSRVELPQVLVQVCTDVTLCLLSLMMSETPAAMSHLLQAVGSLHESGHLHVMQGLLRLFLPQGPKYILKLQQEVTAMRVMISMDTHSHVDGASKVHTIKRYLSDLKDESAINTSGLRCRELDCLRAYYYVAILNFLKESCNSGEVTLTAADNESKETSVDKNQISANIESAIAGDSTVGTSVDVDLDKPEKAETEQGKTDLCKHKQSETDVSSPDSNKTDDETSESKCAEKQELEKMDIKADSTCDKNEATAVTIAVSNSPSIAPPTAPRTTPPTTSPSGDETTSQTHSRSHTVPMLNVNHYSVTVSQLKQLSQGILWDLQAKRFALTETLGYIHKAISQLLLSKNPKPPEGNDTIAVETTAQGGVQSSLIGDSAAGSASSPAFAETGPHSEGSKPSSTPTGRKQDDTSEMEGAISMGTSVAMTSSASKTTTSASSSEANNQNVTKPVLHEHHHCEHHGHELHAEGHICPSLLSHHFDHALNAHAPHTHHKLTCSEISSPIGVGDSESEFKSSYLDVCPCELLQKPRKILWEDEPQFHTRPDNGARDMTNIVNPAKYINVPDEWYNMPVDQKYFKPYVTMAILKDEQEYVMHELKRGPDSTQSPFPNPLESVPNVLDLARQSAHTPTVERQEFVQKVITWALNFAVTTQQKQTYVDMIQSNLES